MRQPKLRKKKTGHGVYWYTEAGGRGKYFGPVATTPHATALTAFNNYIQTLADEARDADERPPGLTVGELADRFLTWMAAHRSEKNLATRRSHCARFARHELPDGRKVAGLPVEAVTHAMLRDWRDTLTSERTGQPAGTQTRLHAETSIRAMYQRGRKEGWVAATCRPFDRLERVKPDLKNLTEADLLTPAEVANWKHAAAIDPDQFRRHGVAKTVKDGKALRPSKPNDCYPDILAVMLDAGARTGEVCRATVRDYSPRGRTISLGRHKTARTGRLRVIDLPASACEVLDRRCAGKSPDDLIFTNMAGGECCAKKLDERTTSVLTLAKLLGKPVRPTARLYDLRHLWISDLLGAGVDLFTVAGMAGNSAAVIERVYGRLRVAKRRDALDRLAEYRQASNQR